MYWAHTNGIGGQSTIIRRKSDNVAVSTYAVTSSLVAKLSFIEELDYLYSSHTGNGRQVTRTTLSNFSRTTYQDGTNNPTYYSSEYYYDGNEYRILWQTADPTTFQNVNVSFSDIATISTSNLPYVSKDIATDDIYVTDQERIYKINKTTNQAEEYFYDPTAISSLQLVYITVA